MRVENSAIECTVVSLLQEGRAIIVLPGLSVVTSFDNAAVSEDGACENPGGGLHQVPGPGVARARVGDQGLGLEAVAHHEPGPVLGTLGVARPEILLCSIIVPLEGQPHIQGTSGHNEALEMLRV